MDRRKFIKRTAAGLTGLSVAPSVIASEGMTERISKKDVTAPISKTGKPLAIAMWDFSWILRHHRYGEFENWEQVISGLAERGYNAIRMDVMPQFVVSTKEGKIIDEFRSVRDDWIPKMWGNQYTMSFRPREALLEFLPICKKYGVKVGLSSWFLNHNTGRTDIFNEEGGVVRAWTETLQFLKDHDLLDNVIYVDLLNEYPNNHGYDWLKQELNKRSDIDQFKRNNPEAHLPDLKSTKKNALQIAYHNQFINQTITILRSRFPELEFFASYDSGVPFEDIDLTPHAAFDYHVWFNHHPDLHPLIQKIAVRDQSKNLKALNADLYSYFNENRASLVDWIDNRLAEVAQKAAEQNKVCGNTEGWGPIAWYDHPELDWKWTRESAEICIDLVKKHDNYKFICTSNFTHPQHKGMWDDVDWHKKMTSRIKQ